MDTAVVPPMLVVYEKLLKGHQGPDQGVWGHGFHNMAVTSDLTSQYGRKVASFLPWEMFLTGLNVLLEVTGETLSQAVSLVMLAWKTESYLQIKTEKGIKKSLELLNQKAFWKYCRKRQVRLKARE